MDISRILYNEITFEPETTAPSATNNVTITTLQNNNINNNNNNEPKHQLCDPNLVELNWLSTEKVGGGLINVGNTCFLNSVLQCLTYCPPLYNFLVKFQGGHSSSCKINTFCMLCEMEKHVKRIKSSTGTSIKPLSIVQRLKYINKSFQFGRQEDAHEFLRYIIDHMWKACLLNLNINTKAGKIDPRIKETTTINHIFGGYHRSQVLCLSCNSKSNTFDFFMDFILDIRNAKSLEDALKHFTRAETLENENAYKCGKCRKKVTARKKFTVFKAPNVATFQLKRFDSDRIFGGKVTKFISYPEEFDLRPYMSETNKNPIKYHLSAVLVHVGHSSNSGHYFCFIKNSNNFWYRMDDSNVTLVNQNTVLQQQAYVLFYTRKSSESKNPSNLSKLGSVNSTKISNGNSNNSSNSISIQKVNTNNNNNNSNNDSLNEISKQMNRNNKITHYFSPITSNKKYLKTPQNGETSDRDIPSNGVTQEPDKQSDNSDFTRPSINGNNINNLTAPLTTWIGTKSNLDSDEHIKHSTKDSERDKFNEELDQGKIKKIKSHNRDERFSFLSKNNLFQRFMSNGYKQYENEGNKNRNGTGFVKQNGRQYSNDTRASNGFARHKHMKTKSNDFKRNHNSHRNGFRHVVKHKNRYFKKR